MRIPRIARATTASTIPVSAIGLRRLVSIVGIGSNRQYIRRAPTQDEPEELLPLGNTAAYLSRGCHTAAIGLSLPQAARPRAPTRGLESRDLSSRACDR